MRGLMLLLAIAVAGSAFGQGKKKAAKPIFRYEILNVDPQPNGDVRLHLRDRNNDEEDAKEKRTFSTLVTVYEFCGGCPKGTILASDSNLDEVEMNAMVEMVNVSNPKRYKCNVVRNFGPSTLDEYP